MNHELIASPTRLVPDERRRNLLLARMGEGAGHSREGFGPEIGSELAMEDGDHSRASAASGSKLSHAAGDSPPLSDSGAYGDGAKKRPRRKPDHPSRSEDPEDFAQRKKARAAPGVLVLPPSSNPALAALHGTGDHFAAGSPPNAIAEAGRMAAQWVAEGMPAPASSPAALAQPQAAASRTADMASGAPRTPPKLPQASSAPPKSSSSASVAAAEALAGTPVDAASAAASAPGPSKTAPRADIRGYFSNAGSTGSAKDTVSPPSRLGGSTTLLPGSFTSPQSDTDATTEGASAQVFSSRNNTAASSLYASAPSAPAAAAPNAEVSRLKSQLAETQRALAAANSASASSASQIAALNERVGQLQTELDAARASAAKAAAEATSGRKVGMVNLRRLLVDVVLKDASAVRRALADRQARLGRIMTTRAGTSVIEMWEDGEEFIALRVAEEKLKQTRVELEKVQKELVKRNKRLRDSSGDKATRGKGTKGNAPTASAAAAGEESDDDDDDGAVGADTDGVVGAGAAAAFGLSRVDVAAASSAASSGSALAELDLAEAEESVKVALSNLKKEEAALAERRRLLEGEKNVLILDLKRQRAEVNSKFRGNPVLGERFMLMDLLGKGGFSEVWRAMDLLEVREVAVKIHQLSPHWTEEKKRSYVRHALREYEIQRALQHPNVVQLHAVIEIDSDSFATVLEFCKGGDLEKIVKSSGILSERDARAIIMQVLSALRYLNGYTSPWTAGSDTAGDASASASSLMPPPKRKIIHYDLKPANILFDEFRNAKVTDFGLSKIIEDDEGATSLELTSQGAGTYWYLPPECFQSGSVRISSKVDVWSVGVIFYQMLYGKRPFGEGQSQEAMVATGSLTQQAMAGPSFPTKPAVSAEAKNFIKRCLIPQQTARPDVLTICEDPYLRMKMRGAT